MNKFMPLSWQIGRFSRTLHGSFPGTFSLDPSRVAEIMGRQTPVLKNGASGINLDFSVVDAFTAHTGVVATIFVKDGDDFIRISTSIRNENGERALGSVLDHSHPGYKNLMAGESFIGFATLFGIQYMTQYDPIRNAQGKVIGAMYAGFDVTNLWQMSFSTKLCLMVLSSVGAIFAAYAWAIGYAVTELVPQHSAAIVELRNRYAVFGAMVLIVLTGFIYLFVRYSVSEPLRDAMGTAQRLAAGDLTTQIHVKRRDEIGLLMQAMNGIGLGLAGVVSNVRRGTDQIALASREIASGNADLSARTESQASSLEQTASSMEELTAAVRTNAENAGQANQLVTSASEIAQEGGAVVGRVVATMESIKESAHKIVDIISVIDSIAFQTNILALNAAVEAARAGEQGRGFAVVAAEVRNLAQRSALAAREIKSLIDNSVEKVDGGSKLVDQAGRTMSDVVAAVKHVADIMGEITSASQEQSLGIEQVNQAIGQMDEMTQQNAALVEQAAAAAQSMHAQADKLSKIVAVFELAQSHQTRSGAKARLSASPTLKQKALQTKAGIEPATFQLQ